MNFYYVPRIDILDLFKIRKKYKCFFQIDNEFFEFFKNLKILLYKNFNFFFKSLTINNLDMIILNININLL